MNRYAFVLLLGGLAAAQTRPPEPPSAPASLVYEFKHVELGRAQDIVNFVRVMSNNRVYIDLNGPFKTAIVHPNGNVKPEEVAQARSLLERYDVAPAPAPRIEFVAYLVWASSNYGSRPGQPIPPAIQDAVAEMKKTFAYTDYTLLDTATTDVRNHAEIQNVLPFATPNGSYFYTIGYGDTNLSSDGKTVTVDPFKFALRVPTGGQYQNVGVTTDIAIHEGQKLVVGKVRMGIGGTVDVFLILTVKLH